MSKPTVIDIPAGSRSAQPTVIDVSFDVPLLENEVVIRVGADSRATIIEHGMSGSGPCFRNARVTVSAGENAKLTYIRLQDAQLEATEQYDARITAETGAEVIWLDAIFGGSSSRSAVAATLAGAKAAFRHKAIFLGTESQRIDVSVSVKHKADRTVSDLACRGVLSGASKATVRGLISVDCGTLGCAGRQELRGLVLDKRAEFDALPQLETATEDVRAGHAASVGRLDREKLFYLMARGLDRPSAVRLLAEGFFAPLVAAMRGSGLEEAASCIIAERLSRLSQS